MVMTSWYSLWMKQAGEYETHKSLRERMERSMEFERKIAKKRKLEERNGVRVESLIRKQLVIRKYLSLSPEIRRDETEVRNFLEEYFFY